MEETKTDSHNYYNFEFKMSVFGIWYGVVSNDLCQRIVIKHFQNLPLIKMELLLIERLLN